MGVSRCLAAELGGQTGLVNLGLQPSVLEIYSILFTVKLAKQALHYKGVYYEKGFIALVSNLSTQKSEYQFFLPICHFL